MIQRFFLKKGSTFTDYSASIREFKTGSDVIDLTTTDYFYIAQIMPFNHLYFKFATVNDQAANIVLEYWDGNNWRVVANFLDETQLSGASFGQDGYISFIPDRNYDWHQDDTVLNSGTEHITGLGSLSIYDMYWMRISFSADLNALTAIRWIGNKFSDDNDLYGLHPTLNRSDLLSSWESGKTDWEEQHVLAAQEIINTLRKKESIYSPGQILDRYEYRLCSIAKTAEMVYTGLGNSWENEAEKAMKKYNELMSFRNKRVDQNSNARLENFEIIPKGLRRV